MGTQKTLNEHPKQMFQLMDKIITILNSFLSLFLTYIYIYIYIYKIINGDMLLPRAFL